MPEVLIVGGGIIGCASALALATRDAIVTVLESTTFAARAASTRAAGILGAQLASHGDAAMLRLCVASRDRYPAWVESLGADVGYRRSGTLLVAFEPHALVAKVEAQRRAGLDAQWLDAHALRELEPSLSDALAGGAFFADDGIVDPPRLLEATRIAAMKAGARFRTEAPVERVFPGGVQLADETCLQGDEVVIAAGSWSGLLDVAPSIEPARGQMIELRMPEPCVGRVVEGPSAYLSPRADGRVLVGSTVERVGFEEGVTAGAVSSLLRGAIELVPALAGAQLTNTWSGFRAVTPDELPILGRAAPGIVIATGHFRDGILLAPITADIVAALIYGEPPPVDLEPFAVSRFG
ncbi:MAG TPA: glycine oxidase ThiO [Polyangiaceae bacterium]|jgi:glycine oxidase|nr:glycine oxidase ThiO [Polyangiaceae bacterium]